MPDLDGFDVLKACDREKLPMVIFVTAFDRYAIDAFKAHALNPFDDKVFEEALQVAKDERFFKLGLQTK